MMSVIADALLALARFVEIALIVKATLLLGGGLAAARLAARSRASVRHLLIAATFGGLLCLPIAAALAPSVAIVVPVGVAGGPAAPPSTSVLSAVPARGAVRTVSSTSATRGVSASWPLVWATVWLAGALLTLAPLVASLVTLRRLRRSALPWPAARPLVAGIAGGAGLTRRVEVLLHEQVSSPLTWGVIRPAIVLPADAPDWDDVALRRALVHELEHVRRFDWLLQVGARVACAAYWCHPLAWVAWRRLCLEAERACDDAVLASGEAADYAEQLVGLASRLASAPQPSLLGMANRSDLSTRVHALLDGHQLRGRVGAPAAAIALVAVALGVAGIAPLRAVPLPMTPDGAGEPPMRATAAGTASSGSFDVGPLDEAIYKAAARGELQRLGALIDAGANVNAVVEGDGSPLIGAARRGQLAAVRLLLDRGADPDMPVPGDGNPLIMAAREGHLAVVTLLLDRGADVNRVVPEDENALIQASGSGHLPVVEVLIARGADVRARVWAGASFARREGEWRTALSMARRGRHEAVVAFLLAAGAVE